MDCSEISTNPHFSLIETLEQREIKPFIRRELAGNQGWGLLGKMYQGAGLLLFGFALIKAFAPFMKTRETVYLESIGWGILFCFTVLIVLHELIHFFAYLSVGAKKLSFGMNLKKFIFYVQADRQVFNYKQFKVVALSPAITVAAISIAGAIIFFEQPLYYFFLTILAFHSLFCMGDLGLLCFFENRPEDEIYTFDLKKEGKTYFYKKNKIRFSVIPEN
ncbi:MAG: DUF3267 domain-containing protein [Paludibacteraceae bacterium]